MNHKIFKNQAGFSIIELMIALSIFAIGLLATATMQITALQGNAGAQKRTMLNTVAAGVMEEILTWEPDHPNLSATVSNVAWDFDPTTGTDPVLIIEDADQKSRAEFRANYFVTRNSPRPSIATVRLVVTSAAGISSWGENEMEITCLKRTQ